MGIIREEFRPFFKDIHGRISETEVVRQYPGRDQTIISAYPDMSRVKFSDKQLKQQQLMKDAAAYASAINRDPNQREAFRKKLPPGESVYRAAVREFMARLKT